MLVGLVVELVGASWVDGRSLGYAARCFGAVALRRSGLPMLVLTTHQWPRLRFRTLGLVGHGRTTLDR